MTATPLRRNRDFLLLQTGLLLSSAGSQMTSIAYPLIVLALTGSAAKAGLVAFVRLFAMALLALPAGLAADHWSRRRLMIGAHAVRAVAIVYADLFRGIPTILVILMLGVGMPSLQIEGIPQSQVFWAIVSLVLVYTAYVSEVYRAGIASVHPSQDAAARSLGLTRFQSLRFVVIPQAVRRVIPPLLNDFIGLQKDTALVSVLGVVEALNQASIDEAATFNGTPYLVAATLFVLITIPLARFTDWLVARDRRKRQATGVA